MLSFRYAFIFMSYSVTTNNEFYLFVAIELSRVIFMFNVLYKMSGASFLLFGFVRDGDLHFVHIRKIMKVSICHISKTI